ncbi:MAG: AraC family transcriptional regulator [Cytophagales bacterium]|nr:AraC family transcriptional regulator [Cytophagales bacterium]
MESHTLPNQLLPYTGDDHVLIYDYHADKESSRQEVILSRHTISFLQEGEKEIIADHNPVAINNTKFLIMRAGNVLMTEKFSSEKAKYSSLLLFFSQQAVLDFIKRHEIDLSESGPEESTTPLAYDPFIRTFVLSLRDLMTLDRSIQRKLLAVKFEELMLYLIARDGTSLLSSLLNHNDQRSFDFVKVVEANKHNKLTLNQLAFLSNMSVSTFKRAFEKHYQESPIKWFHDQRLMHAAYLLKSELRRPSDIYLETGYESLSNFIQAFKQKYGVTPKQYQISNDSPFAKGVPERRGI